MLIFLLNKIMVGKFYFVFLCFKENGGNAFNAKIKEPRVQTRFPLAEAEGFAPQTTFAITPVLQTIVPSIVWSARCGKAIMV